MRTQMRLLAATLLAAAAPLALAQTTGTGGGTAGGTVTTTPNAGQTLVSTKIASNFTTLAGGSDNALALVNALRNGTDVTLTTTVPPPEGSTEPPTTTTTTFTPPTGKMGWGEVKHALALAQDALAKAGLANPTAEQLQTALVGGDIVVTNADGTTTTTTLKGVLTMRSEGMGWGNIAKAGGTKLGPVTSKVKMGNGKAAVGPATTTTTTAAGDAAPLAGKSKGVTTFSGARPSKGITTASGAASGAPGLVTAEGASAGNTPKGNAYGRGIVSAAGGGSVNVAAQGGGKPSGVGVVTASGGAAAGITNAHGNNAGGNGKGNGRGKDGG